MEFGPLSLLPPLLAIMLAIITRDVVISLLAGIFVGFLILNNFNPLEAMVGLLDGLVDLFSEGWIVKTLMFSLMVGAVIRLLMDSGGVAGFVSFLTRKSKTVKSKRGALLLAYITGLVIFIESSITSLVSGTVSRSLCDQYGVSRQKLAYVCDSTSAPVCSILAFNGWGALLIGLITAQVTEGLLAGSAVDILVSSIPYNFYAWLALVLVLIVIWKNINVGAMQRFEDEAEVRIPEALPRQDEGSIWNMLLPLLVLIGMIPLSLYYTGDGDMLAGSGSTSVFYAVITSLFVGFIQYVVFGKMRKEDWFASFYKGLADMLPIVLILLLAFLIGDIAKELETGKYLAGFAEGVVSPALIPVIVFILAAVIAFSTGTSWGTFSIMMPIAIALAVTTGAHVPLVIGAVISGGIFGDHASPISDTTIISSMAAGCDHIEHVNSQLPYALFGAVLSSVLFVAAGFVLT